MYTSDASPKVPQFTCTLYTWVPVVCFYVWSSGDWAAHDFRWQIVMLMPPLISLIARMVCAALKKLACLRKRAVN
jgi:hypothetical protein